jgi:hypothetical protein
MWSCLINRTCVTSGDLLARPLHEVDRNLAGAPSVSTIGHMTKRPSHSSQIFKVLDSDGSLSFRRLTQASAPISLGRQLGPEAGEDLLAWASTTKPAGAARINAILQLIVELEAVSRKSDKNEHTFVWRGTVFTARVRMGRGSYPERSEREVQLAHELSLRLLRYKVSPWYWMTLGDFPIFGWWSGKNRPKDKEDPTEDAWFTEEDAVVAIVDLARAGVLYKIRHCHCGDWFFAKFIHQRFCCLCCQQKYYRSSDDYKAMRRAYMKNLRDLHKRTYLVSPKERGERKRIPRS